MFVSWNEQQSANAQNRALSKSRVRAHAARVAHQRTLDNQSRSRASSSSHVAREEANQREQSPGTIIVWKGNSDPFGSQKIDVTPRLNEILNFLQDVWIPATHTKLPEPFPSAVRTCFCTMAMINPLAASDDQAVIISNLLPTASALVVLTGNLDLKQHSAKLKASTIARLRQRLFRLDNKSNTKKKSACAAKVSGGASIVKHETLAFDLLPRDAALQVDDVAIALTRSLFVAAVIEGNVAEADAHGNMLQWLLRCQTAQKGFVAVQVDELCLALGFDLVRSQLTATCSLFDVDKWLPACLEANKLPMLDELAAFRQHVRNRLDKTAQNTPLEDVFLGTHQCFKLWTKAGDPESELDTKLIWQYVTLSNLTLQLQTTNYSRVVETLLGDEGALCNATSRMHWRIQACLAYSILLWQLTNIMDVKIAARSYWPRGTMIADSLRAHIQAYHTEFAKFQHHLAGEHNSALLFAYWTGATWLRKENGPNLRVSDCFFHRGLNTLANIQNLHCAEDVKAIVESFLPSIHMRPRDWDWLDAFLQSSSRFGHPRTVHVSRKPPTTDMV